VQFQFHDQNPAILCSARDWQFAAEEAAIDVNLERIDFISEYCDRWCERCAFTTRCSAYAVEAALAMCDGNFRSALELAVGAPPPRDAAEAARREAFLEEFTDSEPTQLEMDAFVREEQARAERVDESPIETGTARVRTLSHEWIERNQDIVDHSSDPQLGEAINIARWDVHLIGAKLHRALHGHDRFVHGNPFEDEPVQNDWNGSAKVALICIGRSAIAWSTIARIASDPDAADIAQELHRLKFQVERMFPDAWKFIRPGFDQRE
jgi:hypothetical protein